MKVKWFTKPMSVVQVVTEGVEYAFLSENDEQCYPLLTCKEFLIDTVWATVNNFTAGLYGFSYDPGEDPPISLSRTRVLVRNQDDYHFDEHVKASVKFLNQLEDIMGVQKTEVEECEKKNNHPVYALNSPYQWMHAPPMLSLYALMIRVGMDYNGKDTAWRHIDRMKNGVGEIRGRNANYLRTADNTIREVVETCGARFCEDMKDNYPGDIRQFYMHEYSGIVSLASGAGKFIVPEWYKKNKEEDADDSSPVDASSDDSSPVLAPLDPEDET